MDTFIYILCGTIVFLAMACAIKAMIKYLRQK